MNTPTSPEFEMLVPRIASEWRELFRPVKTGCYINDHSIIRAVDGKWHLFGITSHEPHPEKERYFAHGSGPSLWSDSPLTELGQVCDDGVRAWAPCVVGHENRYFMLYGPSPTKLAVSRDLRHWMGAIPKLVGAPLEACHRDHMVLKIDAGTWLMYASGIDDDGLGVISLFESDNLVEWRYLGPALQTRGTKSLRCAWGAAESPFVFLHGGWHYLSITYTDCNKSNYHDSVVFRSRDPRDFGVYDLDNPDLSVIARLTAHAPEYLHNTDDDTWYITTCGWPGFGIPHEGAVSVAKLEWVRK